MTTEEICPPPPRNIVRLQIIYLLEYNNGWVLPHYFTSGGVGWGWAGNPLDPPPALPPVLYHHSSCRYKH